MFFVNLTMHKSDDKWERVIATIWRTYTGWIEIRIRRLNRNEKWFITLTLQIFRPVLGHFSSSFRRVLSTIEVTNLFISTHPAYKGNMCEISTHPFVYITNLRNFSLPREAPSIFREISRKSFVKVSRIRGERLSLHVRCKNRAGKPVASCEESNPRRGGEGGGVKLPLTSVVIYF